MALVAWWVLVIICIFAAINFLSFLFYWKFVPETKFHYLEELELKFQKDYS